MWRHPTTLDLARATPRWRRLVRFPVVRLGTSVGQRLLAVAAVVAFLGAGCGGDPPEKTTSKPSGAIVVSAAASLTGAFSTIRDQVVERYPGVEVTVNFGSSGSLAEQVRAGAPADVVAFADATPMESLDQGGLLAATPQIFARNRLVIVVKPGNPEHVSTLADLARVGVISLCVETAPCGKFANRILQHAGVEVLTSSISRGADVKATLGSVTEGDAAAGIVYSSDAKAAETRVATVEIPDSDNVVNDYPIAVVAASKNPRLAQAFVDQVRSDAGRAVLKDAGFLEP